jgi:hypothetical protein
MYKVELRKDFPLVRDTIDLLNERIIPWVLRERVRNFNALIDVYPALSARYFKLHESARIKPDLDL